MKRSWLGLVLLLFTGAGPVWADLCGTARLAGEEATRLRNLPFRQVPPCEVKDRESIRRYVLSIIDTKLPPERLKHEELSFKLLGMIPEEYDYKKGIVEMYTSQIGGFYDPDTGRFVMADWIPEVMQMPVAVHEMTHGLQDQHFNLKRFMDMEKLHSDQQLARSALVEGDATLLMFDYSREKIGQRRLMKEDGVEGLIAQSLLGAAIAGLPQNTPESLKMMMLFPYTSGLRFAHVLVRKGGMSGLDSSFRSGGPRSTEEVLHPDKYFQKEADFIDIKSDELRALSSWPHLKAVHSDSLGEFGVSALLAGYVSNKKESSVAAAGWGGDLFLLLSGDQEKRSCLVWKSIWDTASDADEFEKLYRQVLSSRFNSGVEGLSLQKAGKQVVFRACRS